MEIEKYLIGMVELLTKAEHNFPFLFASCLKDLLMLMTSMMFKSIPQGRYTH